MGAADRIAEVILRQGEIAGRGAQNTGAIWGGALQNLGQQITALPTYVQNQRMREQEVAMRGQEMQMRDQQMQQLQRAQQSQDAANKVVASFPRRADGTYDVGGMIQQMSGSGVHPADVEHYGRTFESLNQLSTAAVEAQRQHQARAADIILSGAQGKEITPEDVHVALATLKTLPGGLVTDDDEQAWTQAFAAGQDPRKFLESVSRAGKGPQKPITNTVEAGIAAGMTPQAVFDREKPPPTAPAPKVPNTRYEAIYTANVKDPAHPTNDELAIVDAKMAAGEAPKNDDEFQTFKKAYAKKLLGPDGQWEKLTPDQQIQGNSAYTISKADPATRALAESNAQIRNLLLQSQLGNQPTKEDAALMAKQVVEHKMAPSQIALFGGMGAQGTQFKRMVGTEALKLDPNFDWEQAESDYQFGKTPGFQSTMRYIQSVGPDMARLKKNADILANGDIRSVNALINAGKNQVNNVDLKKYQTDRLLVSDVIAKILQGGGTGSGVSDSKLKQAGEILKDSDSPAATAGALEEALVLIGNREKTLARGTYFERQKPEAAATPTSAPKYTVGQTVIYNGQRRKVASINPDGTATLAPGVVP